MSAAGKLASTTQRRTLEKVVSRYAQTRAAIDGMGTVVHPAPRHSVLPPHHGCGYATEAAAALVAWAFAHREIESVTAETLPDLTASIRVMEKCGMRFVGDGNPEEGQRTVRYAITRNQLRVRQ